MMLTTLNCRQRGVTFAAVHDCFWTHACDVETMNEICRDQFIKLHSEPIVENLGKVNLCPINKLIDNLQQLRDVFLSNEIATKMENETYAQFQKSLTPSTKRGTLDIEQVRKSVYFFS